MDEDLTRIESDELSGFMEHIELLERFSPLVTKLEGCELYRYHLSLVTKLGRWELYRYRLTGAEIAIKEAVELLMEKHEGENDSWLLELKNVPEAVSRALQKDGDRGSFDALIELMYAITAHTTIFITIANLSDVIGLAVSEGSEKVEASSAESSRPAGSLSRGFKELSKTFAGRHARFMGKRERSLAEVAWLIALHRTMHCTLRFVLYLIIEWYLKGMRSCPTYHCYVVLSGLLRDSAVRRAIRSVPYSEPFNLKSLYRFFNTKTPKIYRYVNEVVNYMKRHDAQYIPPTTNVEPSVVALSYMLYCHPRLKKDVTPYVHDHIAVIDLLNELGLEAVRRLYEQLKGEAERATNFLGKKAGGRRSEKKPVALREYYELKLVAPYGHIFRLVRKAAESGDVKPLVKELTRVAVAFLSHVFPFIYVSADGHTILIRGETKKDIPRLLEEVTYGFPLSALYVVQVLNGIHAWKRLTYDRERSETVLKRVFEGAKAANYDPFLPPEAMARHAFLVVDSLFFKLANALLNTAGRSDLVFELTGDFEEDMRRLWNALPPEYREKLKVRDEGELLRLIERESYDLLMQVQKAPLEWYSVRFAKLLEKRVKGL
jgi:hypothetical protein